MQRFKLIEKADSVYNSLAVSKGKYREIIGASPAFTPTSSVGVGVGNAWIESAAATNFNTPQPRFAFQEALQASNVQHQITNLPSTPTMNPGLADTVEWKTHVKEVFSDDKHKWLTEWRKPASYAQVVQIGSQATSNIVEIEELD